MQKKLLALITQIFMVASPGAAAATTTLELVQQAEISGKYDLLLAKGAIKATNLRTGVIIYSQAPKWDLLICNPRLKVFAKMPAEKFSGKMTQALANFDAELLSGLTWAPIGPGKLYGLPVTYQRLTFNESTFREASNERKHNKLWTVNCAVYTPSNLPVSVCHALERLYGVPLIEGIPIRITYLEGEGTMKTALETFSCKPGGAALNYTVPATYRKVAKEMDVFAAPSTNSGLDFFRQ